MICRQCKKDLRAFYFKSSLAHLCNFCVKDNLKLGKKRRGRKPDPERVKKTHKEYNRKYNYKSKYNITVEDFSILLEEQNFSCKICKTNQNDLKKTLAVDHDHTTGKVRGLLCHKCNSALGLFKDSTESLKRAIQYLEAAND